MPKAFLWESPKFWPLSMAEGWRRRIRIANLFVKDINFIHCSMSCILCLVLRCLWLLAFVAGSLSALGQDSLRLSLEQAVAQALQRNYDVQIAAVNAAIAGNNNFEGATGMLPTVNATVGDVFGVSGLNQKLASGVEQSKLPVYANNLNASVALSWRVFDGWRMYAVRDRLNATEALGKLAYENTLRTTVFDVCLAYYGLVRLQTQQQALRETIAFFEERERLAKARFETGVTAKGEWLLAQTDLNEQRSALLRAQSAYIQASMALYQLIIGDAPGEEVLQGHAPAYLLIAPTDNIPRPFALQPSTQDLMDSARQHNPLLLASTQSLAVALAQRKEAASLKLPQLTVNSAFNALSNRSTAGFLLLNQSAGLNAGFTLSVPIFDGQVANRQIRAAEMNIEARNLEAQRLRQEVYLALSRLQADLQLALDQIEIEEINLVLARENAEITQERYRRAQATAIELRQAQLAYIEAQTRLVEARYAACLADLQLRLLAGLPIR